MCQKQNSNSVQPNVVNNEIQQEVGRNQGQIVGQMTDSQAVSAQEIGVFVSGGSVIFQNSGSHNLQMICQKKREIPSLLPYLSDRIQQEFKLREKIKTHLQQPQNCPLVCIIHGDEFQSQDKFLERLQKVILPRMLKSDATKVVIKEYLLHWPSGVKDLEKLPEHMCKSLAEAVEGYSFASAKDINQTFCKYPNPIIVHTHLLTEDWKCQGPRVLPKLLEFWNNWPELAPNQKLIVCIFIKYQLKRHKNRGCLWCLRHPLSTLKMLLKRNQCCKLNRKINQQIEEMSQSGFSQFRNLNGVVLPKLSGISRTDVENWVRQEETKEFIGEAMKEKLIVSVRDMFDQWELQASSSTMSMDELAEQLIELLKPLISFSE